MKFDELINMQHLEMQRTRAQVNESFAQENKQNLIQILESNGVDNADLFVQLFEAVDELPMKDSDVKKIEKEFDILKCNYWKIKRVISLMPSLRQVKWFM